MVLACIADGGYVRHTAAMLDSALRHTSEPITVHVLHARAMAPADRDGLRETVEALGGRLGVIAVSEHMLTGLRSGEFAPSVWLRVFLCDLLADEDRVLYLDSDLIVVDDLAPLWHTAMSEHLVAAVTNPLYPFMPPYPREQLGIERPEEYFNSGVMLMNLRLMRSEGTLRRLLSYARENPTNLYPDQDALNVVCQGRWLHLHPRWNVQSTLYELPPRELPMRPGEVAEALESPAAIHFIGPFKPWHFMCRHPRRSEYFEHAAKTTWGRPHIEGRTIKHAILRGLPLAWIDRWMRLERATRRANLRARLVAVVRAVRAR